MPRRSARLASLAAVRIGSAASDLESPSANAVIGNHENSPSINPEESDEEPVRPQKRQQQSKSKKPSKSSLQSKNARGRRGKLKDIVEMPLDILNEIFLYLTPVEILSLSRMCKALRHVLMTKSAQYVWKQARLNLDDFPDCPDDLNEAQFANLIFGALCNSCNKARGRHIIWSVRRCYCGTCITRRKGLIWTRKFKDVYVNEWNLSYVLPWIDSRTKTENFEINHHNLVHEASANKLLDEFRQIHESDHSAQVAWIQELKDKRQLRITHGRLCEEWLEKEDGKRATQLAEIRKRRYEAITQRLTDLGWGKELETVQGMESWPSVKQPKALTDRTWENIKDDIIQRMEGHRAWRLQEDYLAAQRDRRRLLKELFSDLREKKQDKMIFPNLFELESTEQISTLIRAPTEETIDEFLESTILECTQNWRTSCDTVLRKMVITGTPRTPRVEGVDPLSLATTFFSCWKFRRFKSCHVLQYPEVVTHDCATLTSKEGPCLWNVDGERVIFDDKAHHLAESILGALGFNPNTTKREDVEWPALIVECHECPGTTDGPGRVLMSWYTTVRHALKHDSRDERACMSRADLSETELQRLHELSVVQFDWTTEYSCVRCKELHVSRTWYSIECHIREEHQEEPKYLMNYIVDIGVSKFRPQASYELLLRPGSD